MKKNWVNFQGVSLIGYAKQLQGYDDATDLEFAFNFQHDKYMVG